MKKATQKSTGRNAGAQVLAALADRNESLTLDHLDVYLPKVPRRKITSCICRLITDGYAVRRSAGCYEVTARGRAAHKRGYTSGPQGPLTAERKNPDNLRTRIWRALRIKRRATLGELLAYSVKVNEPEQAAYDNAAKYVRGLRAAGVVKKLSDRERGTAPTSNGFHVYLLVDDLGPQTPVLRSKSRSLFNPNSGEEIAFSTAPLARGGAA